MFLTFTHANEFLTLLFTSVKLTNCLVTDQSQRHRETFSWHWVVAFARWCNAEAKCWLCVKARSEAVTLDGEGNSREVWKTVSQSRARTIWPGLALPQWYSHSFCYEITSSWGGTVHISAILFPEIKELWSKLPRSIGWVWIVPRNKWDLRAKEMRTISLWWRFTHCFAGSLPSRPVPPAEDQETRFDSCFTLLFLLYVTDFIAFVKYQQGKQDRVRPRTPLALTQHKRGTSPLWGGTDLGNFDTFTHCSSSQSTDPSQPQPPRGHLIKAAPQ